SFLSPPSDPFVAVFEREFLILLFTAVSWAWSCLGIKLASLARVHHNPAETFTGVLDGHYIETAPSVILGVFIGVGSVVFLYIKARQGPGPYLFASIFGYQPHNGRSVSISLLPDRTNDHASPTSLVDPDRETFGTASISGGASGVGTPRVGSRRGSVERGKGSRRGSVERSYAGGGSGGGGGGTSRGASRVGSPERGRPMPRGASPERERERDNDRGGRMARRLSPKRGRVADLDRVKSSDRMEGIRSSDRMDRMKSATGDRLDRVKSSESDSAFLDVTPPECSLVFEAFEEWARTVVLSAATRPRPFFISSSYFFAWTWAWTPRRALPAPPTRGTDDWGQFLLLQVPST
ncbi:hypothetical protein FA15DRAFT_711455, partial [Coprinopsis marcescibilis]